MGVAPAFPRWSGISAAQPPPRIVLNMGRIAFTLIARFCTHLGWVTPLLFCSVALADEKTDYFEAKVRPLLVDHCYECHSVEADESAGELQVDTRAALLTGGTRGPAMVPGDPDESLLLQAVSYDDPGLEMPPDGQLEDEQIEVLRKWIADGAVDPRKPDPAPPEPEETEQVDPANHWAFQPFHAAVPPADAAAESTSVLDALVNAHLQAGEHGVQLNPPAAAKTLVRRLTFDLTGLPATAAEVQAFVEDRRADAYERLVDRLLATPQFGERFGRHWLDVARYADTVGYTLAGRERRLAGSERYRDWVINAFNQDLPYDSMIRYQLAADRLDPENAAGHLDAMGFITVGRRFLRGNDTIDDRIDVIGRGLLGLTVACARCHDHKFDPIPTMDYYALFGVMQSSRLKEDGPSPLMMEDHKPHDAHVLIRGQAGNRGPVAPRQFLTALRSGGSDDSAARFKTGSGRLDLAEKIATADNPLTARVMVNRVWMHLIGTPLVATPSDFGVRSAPPEVPGMLDDLATSFAADWSIKRLVRRIVCTDIYRRSSEASEAAIAADPDNLRLTRANRRRRDFESLRDSLLMVSDRLETVIGGEPVDILVTPTPPRRTVYAFIDRQNLPGLFRTFDFASPDAHTPRRAFTTVPQQALFLMNDPMVLASAVRVADGCAERTDEAAIEHIYRTVLARSPSAEERAEALAFLALPDTVSEPLPDPRDLWQYGFSTVGEDKTATSFERFTYFKDGRWQHPEAPEGGRFRYLQLTRTGGHPGPGNQLAANRRWIAPADGHCEVIGQMEHPSMQGNGVQITIANGNKVLWETHLSHRPQPYGPIRFAVTKGDAIDFLASDHGSTSHDSFRWKIAVHFEGEHGQKVDSDSELDFSGPYDRSDEQPLSRREQFAHALLISNEFIFVD
ncbi:PSD1 and planctomycete cytochrome C domain-containing protein [Roseimaritima ulvae]|uniref:Planctomycete cytochrome C n=1 Tax=Roseimaritima ulvae TaxID=980254 RepID=A0A5B9QSH5_9BACT|nr:PSD1 and planctomycete cytochrome C domain-containing protein [Roseimaritima ulvae]QEG40345.1 Planctomycete cytochrome C [Roseimaritima ulvae]